MKKNNIKWYPSYVYDINMDITKENKKNYDLYERDNLSKKASDMYNRYKKIRESKEGS